MTVFPFSKDTGVEVSSQLILHYPKIDILLMASRAVKTFIILPK